MMIVVSILGFLAAAFLGGLASSLLLEAYEDKRPWLGETPSEERRERITKHKKKMAFKAGIVIGVIWLIYYWWPWLSTI
jgi:hypothetical protein